MPTKYIFWDAKILAIHKRIFYNIKNRFYFIWNSKKTHLKCKVVELSMQCCGKLFSDSFEPY